VKFVPENGNFVPKDFRGEASYGVDKAGHLRLEGLWLGDRDDDGTGKKRACSYEFAPR
jgi:hypothetical protein